MPYEIIKTSPRCYSVINSITGSINAKCTSLAKAQAQIRLLHSKGYSEKYFGGACICGCGLIRPEDQVFLKASEESYKEKNNRDLLIGNYTYDPEISTARTAVYVGPMNVIIAHRGTVVGDISDLKQDALILAGQFDKSDRLKRALQTVEETIRKYPNLQIINTGHSLGGKVASNIGKFLSLKNSKVVGFNIGSSPVEIAANLKNKVMCSISNSDLCKKLKNQTLYTTGFDPVSISALSHVGTTHIVKPESANVHSLASFK